MADIAPEKQSAKQYDDRTTVAVKRALVEIGQILGSYQGQFAVVGGSVPSLLIKSEEMGHVGTADIDLGLDPAALGEGEYAKLVKTLMDHGYAQRDGLRRFQLVRQVDPKDGGEPIDVVVDFLMPRNAAFVKNVPPLVDDFAVIRADGAELALHFQELVAIEAEMPDGGVNRVEIAVASIPALLAMKGHALAKREKRKDAYDIYYCVLNYPSGLQGLADDCRPLLAHENGERGFRYIDEKFASFGHIGPLWVREFVDGSQIQGARTLDQWQQDAFGQVDAWLRALGFRN
jgi:hypothetical protein